MPAPTKSKPIELTTTGHELYPVDPVPATTTSNGASSITKEIESPPAKQNTVVHPDEPSIEAYINTEGSVSIDLGRAGLYTYSSVEELAEILGASELEWEPEPPVVSQYRFYRPETHPPMPTAMGQVDAEIGHLNEVRRQLYAEWESMPDSQKAVEYERARS